MENIQKDLNDFCKSNNYIKILFQYGTIIMLVGCILGIVSSIPFLQEIFYIDRFKEIWTSVFYVGVILTFANGEYKMLSIGFFVRFLTFVFFLVFGTSAFLRLVYYILAILFTGYIAYNCYKK